MSSLRLCLLAATGTALLAGCAGPRAVAPEPAPQPMERINAAPTGRVDANALPPVEGAPAEAPAPVDMANVAPSGPVTQQQLLGGWQVSSGGSSCQMFLTMTSWTGGYRASTRGGCSGDMSNVNAWAYDGGRVVLKDNSGGTVATLSAQSNSSMSGATSGGQSVSASRS